eukprot:1744460-Rhodomonas_salina.2
MKAVTDASLSVVSCGAALRSVSALCRRVSKERRCARRCECARREERDGGRGRERERVRGVCAVHVVTAVSGYRTELWLTALKVSFLCPLAFLSGAVLGPVRYEGCVRTHMMLRVEPPSHTLVTAPHTLLSPHLHSLLFSHLRQTREGTARALA